jgi:MFS family permease
MTAAAPIVANAPSPFAPFKQRLFAMLWTSALIANVGTWFRDVANGWLMTELAPSPVMVALVQAAASLPVFLLSLPAGALADTLDRRKLLIGVQIYLACVSLCLLAAVSAGIMTPELLLVLTLAGGIGLALTGPAWQSIVPEVVPKPELRAAIALNSMGINVARAIGPAVGGWILAVFGVALAYALDALSYLFIIAALALWKRPAPASTLGPERFWPSMATGARYVLQSSDIQCTLTRSAAFFIFASAYWALLPLVARQVLAGDATLYGILLTSIGAGAVIGALVLPWATRDRSPDAVVLTGTLLTACAMATLALAPNALAAAAALFVAGAAWIAVLTTLNITAQSVLPNWVRARGLAVYITVFFGAVTLGSTIWGQVASATDVPTALLVAAVGGAVAGVLAMLVKLPKGDADLTPSLHWPEPATAAPVPGERGPVMVEIAYRIDLADRHAFLSAIEHLARVRKRDGATGWQIFEDVEVPERFVEVFFTPSWLDHLRQHERITKADEIVQAAVTAFHRGPDAPSVRHFVAASPHDETSPRSLPPQTRPHF